MTNQERAWVEAQIARYPDIITPAQRAKLVEKFRARWPYSGGPSLDKETFLSMS